MSSTGVLDMIMKTGVEVILRVPALVIIDQWSRTTPKQLDQIRVLYYFAPVLAVAMEVIPLKKLVALYKCAISLFLLFVSYYLSFVFAGIEIKENVSYNINNLLGGGRLLERVLFHLISQCVLAAIISYLVEMKNWSKLILLIFTLPVFTRLLGWGAYFSLFVHDCVSVLALFLIVIYLFYSLSNTIDIYRECRIQKYSVYVAQNFIFAVVIFSYYLYSYSKRENIESIKIPNRTIDKSEVVVLLSLIQCCDTFVGYCAILITISSPLMGVVELTKYFLQWNYKKPLHFDNDPFGSTRIIYCLYIGIYFLEAAGFERVVYLISFLFIMLSALIYPLYEIVFDILLVLGLSTYTNWINHAHVLTLCGFLWISPLLMSYFIYSYFELNFWFSLLISDLFVLFMQLISSAVVCILLICDTSRTVPWKGLDDLLYWVNLCNRIVEVLVPVFGIYYCYVFLYNFFVEFKVRLIIYLLIQLFLSLKAWQGYLLSRKASKSVEFLLRATREQLEINNEDCYICGKKMQSARITHCLHIFHGACLRKWLLYVKDTCPECHQVIFKDTDPGKETGKTVDVADCNRNSSGENYNHFESSTDQSDSD